MKVLVLGGGGKEHALVWKLSESKHIDKVYCSPGNPGIAEIAECIDINPYSAEALVDFVKYEWIDFTIVSSEEFIAKGMVDVFEREGCKALGPNAAVSRLRSSRVFAKNLMRLHRVPSPDFRVFSSYDLAEDYVRLKGAPIVIRTDGHSNDAGVFSAQTVDEAIQALRLIMKEKIAGDAGNQVIIEEGTGGERVSFVFFTDGHSVKPLASLRKYSENRITSRTYGAVSPAPAEGSATEAMVMSKALAPLVRALTSEGISFKGVLSLDLILNDEKVLVSDINCNFAHLEAQVILPRLKTDLAEIVSALLEQRLSETVVECRQESSASISVCGKTNEESVIAGLNRGGKDIFIFHENTFYKERDIVTAGGHALSVTALGADSKAAMNRAEDALTEIGSAGMLCERLSDAWRGTALRNQQGHEEKGGV